MRPFELIECDPADPLYRGLAAQHLSTVAEFNKDDLRWGVDGRWEHLIEIERSLRHDPYNVSPAAGERINAAWELARKGSGLWLTGTVELFGGRDSIRYTPKNVRWMDDFADEDFAEEERLAYNYRQLVKSRLYIVR